MKSVSKYIGFYIHYDWALSPHFPAIEKDFIKLVKKTEQEINASGGIANKPIKIFYDHEIHTVTPDESSYASLSDLYKNGAEKYGEKEWENFTDEEKAYKGDELLEAQKVSASDSLTIKNSSYANRINSLDGIHFISYVPYGFESKLLDIDNYFWFADPFNNEYDPETDMPLYHTKGFWNYFDTSSHTNLGWRQELKGYFGDKEVIVLVNNRNYRISMDTLDDEKKWDEYCNLHEEYSLSAKKTFGEYGFKVKFFDEHSYLKSNSDDSKASSFDPNESEGKENLKKWFKGLNNNQVVVVSQRIHYMDAMPGSVLLNSLNGQDVLEWYQNIYSTFLETPSSGSLVSLDLSSEEANMLNEPSALPRKKIYAKRPKNFQSFIRLQDIHNEINPTISQGESEELASAHIFLDQIKLVQYVFSKSNYIYDTKQLFLKETSRRLSMVNGIDDIFIGDNVSLEFNEENKNKNKGELLVEVRKNAPDTNVIDSSLYRKQLLVDQIKGEVIATIPTNYINIDIIRFSNISIEEGIFTAKFYFEITTSFKEGIDIISFNNSTLDSASSIVLIKKSKVDDEYNHYRYLIEDTFSFEAIPDNYPFDKQIIYIAYSILNEEEFGILQPIQKGDIDTSFQLDGWSLTQTRSGIYREKIKQRTILSNPSIKEESSNKVGWMIERSSSMTMLKVLIPLSFLWTLVIYGLFLPLENLDRAVGVITTSFLSGIALYFSTERPQPLKMTVIDLVFASFYFTVGAASISVFSLNFFPDVYDQYMTFIKYALPISVFFVYWYLRRRINSKEFHPRMTKD